MASKLDIWNAALGRVADDVTIDHPDEESAAARACRRHYAIARDETLAGFSWGFARRRVKLAAIATPPPTGWPHLYAHPTDAISVQRVGPLVSGDQALCFDGSPFHHAPEVAKAAWETLGITAPDGAETTVLGSAVPDAWCAYVRRVTDETLYPPLFVSALAWRLAVDIAMALARGAQMRQTAWEGYNALLDQARAAAGREDVDTLPESELIRARF